MDSEQPIRVLIADDHPVVRDGLAALLGTLPGLEVVGQVGDGAAAVRETALAQPDVVVMDLRLPGVDGVAATQQITREYPQTAVLVLTMYDEDALIASAIAAGARGYLLKGAEQAEIERAIRAVASGEAIFSRDVADRVLRQASTSAAGTGPPFPQLTPRERQVTELLAQGFANAAIAQRLSLAPKTVGNHVSAIFLKLGVATRAEAIVAVRNAGLGGGP